MYFTWSKILVSLGNIPIECRLSIPHLRQGLVFFLQGGGGWVHLCISLLHVVDLVVLPLLVPRDFPVRLRKLVTIFTLEWSYVRLSGGPCLEQMWFQYLLKSVIA